MAKEMMIVFVYDTARCSREDDDPAEAVMYFHPAWVSPTQRLALAGQLMGVNQFLTNSFAEPCMISLQGGKFVLKKFGKYMLAVGTDRNIHDWILERRADILESLLKFFHCDFNTISSSLNNDRNKFTEKLYQMFETYLPILQYSASLFSNIPVLKLPRSASNIFLEAIQVLQYCQETNGIMGGAIFYNNKVIASQLSAQITKQLVITDPYRIKAPAERISTTFHLPVGVQLLRVYIQQRHLIKMLQNVNTKRMFNSYAERARENGTHKKDLLKSNLKDQPISMMKRDTSRIFTVPEEGELETSLYRAATRCRSPSPPTMYESPVKRIDEAKLDRSKYANPLTPSVCSTPLKDVNRVLHGTAVSICSTAEETNNKSEVECDSKSIDKNVRAVENVDDIPDVVKEALRCKRLNKLRNVPPREKLIKESKKRSLSMGDLEDSLQKHTNNVPLRTYGLGLPKLNKNLCVNYDGEVSYETNPNRFFNTISDPCYPVFRRDGLPVSGSLYNQYISDHYTDKKDVKNQDVKNVGLLSLDTKHDANKDMEKSSKEGRESLKSKASLDVRLENSNKSKQETYRRSMSLPLKPLNAYDGDDRRKSASECGEMFELPQRRKLDGLQLTPLMSKLSLLADERTSGFCSRETTPSEFRDLSSSFSLGAGRTCGRNQSELNKDSGSDEDEIVEDWSSGAKDSKDFAKGELFLCGHQNTVMVLIMEDGTTNNPELIHSLWETCVGTLGRLETRLQQCLDPLPSNESKELYSVLSVDSEWDTVHRSGLWGVTELDMVSLLHERFTKARNLTDIIVRTEDTVVYGNQCGKVQVFYQQAMSSNTSGGLPTPADLMGVVPLKAKRRLERDHGIMLL